MKTSRDFKFFRGGATLVISLDALNWFSKRKCSSKGLKKREEDVQLWISSGQMIQVDDEPQPITRFCIRNEKQNATFYLGSNIGSRWSSVKPCLSPQHCRLLQEPVQQSTSTSLDPLVTGLSKDATGTTQHLKMRDIFNMITKDFNMVTMEQHQSFIVFCCDNIPPQHFSDMCYIQGRRTFTGTRGFTRDLKSVTAASPFDPNNNNNDAEGGQRELVIKDNHHPMGNLQGHLKSIPNCHNVGLPSVRERNKKMRKSVSFDDDVMVYLFHQESPTAELHSEPSRFPCTLSDVALEDNALEWEDDFSALEKNCHFQCIGRSQDYTLSLPTQRWTSLPRPERFSLSQTSLFLTHITESDLEL